MGNPLPIDRVEEFKYDAKQMLAQIAAATAAGQTTRAATLTAAYSVALTALVAANAENLPLTVYNVRSFGAVGDGVSDDTLAIKVAIDVAAAAGGGVVFIPAGTYLLSAQGADWTNHSYCIRPAASASHIVIRGVGQASKLTLALNQHGAAIWHMLALHKLTGRVIVEAINFAPPAPITPGSTPGQGPSAITIGEMGGTASTGNLNELQVRDCFFSNVSFAAHGEGCGIVTYDNNVIAAAGGGLYPSYFCEVFNLGSRAATRLMDLTISRNFITNDSVYGDHIVYTLGAFKRIVVRENTWTAINHEALKFDGGGLAGVTTDAIIVENNVDTRTSYVATDGQGTSLFMVMSAPSSTPSVGLLRVVGNKALYSHQFLYSEWAILDAEVSGNDARFTQDSAILFIHNAGLTLQGFGCIANNNFNDGNVGGLAVIQIKPECFTHAVIANNKALAQGGSGRFISDGELTNRSRLTCIGNDSNLSVAWIDFDNGRNLTDFGNSWTGNLFYGATVPSSGTYKRSDIKFNTLPVAGGPLGWVCLSGGTPGTWAEFGHSKLQGSAVIDPASLADGAAVTIGTITVTGAALGDLVVGISSSLDLAGLIVTGYVSSANTVTIRAFNKTGGAVDLASSTWIARVAKQ